jgi:hypothetical protein
MAGWKSAFLLKSLETSFKRLVGSFNRSLSLWMIQTTIDYFNAYLFTQHFDFANNL